MGGARGFVLILCCLPALLAAGCESTPSRGGQAVSDAPSAVGQLHQPAFLLPSSVSLSDGCAEEVVTERLRALAQDVSRGDGTAVAAHFLVGPDLRWEVNEHADAPNGTLGALRTVGAISTFVQDVHARGEVWVSDQVVPPTQRAEGSSAVYGFGIAITSGGMISKGVAKVVIDCATGRVSHMVGPGT